jgi:hypothetical protein
MTPALLQDFIKKDVPVVFPADPVDRNAAFVDMCKRSSLLAKYGDHEVVLSSSNAHSYVGPSIYHSLNNMRQSALHLICARQL